MNITTRFPFSLIAAWLFALNLGLAAETNAFRDAPLPVPSSGKTGFTSLPPGQTGVTFTNELSDWASAENRVLNNGSGVAAGDFDNDGRIDLFFSSLNNQNRLFRNLGHWRFADVTAQTGLKFPPGYYRAAVFADLNGDGWLDLLVGAVGNGVLCFLNDGQGRFTDATALAGTSSRYATESVALADIDGNGTLDLYVTNNRTDDIRDWLRIPVVLVNKKPTVPPALRDRITFESGQLQEFGEPHILYLNDGRARFAPVSWTNGKFLDERGQPLAKAPLDWGLTAAFRDLNDDGAPDLYVCNDYWTPDRIWINAGDGRLRAIAPLAIRKICASSMGVDFSDVNRDGHLDIFVVDMLSRSSELRKRQIVAKRPTPPRIGDIETRIQTPQNTLLLNRGDGTYAEIASLAGLQASDWSWSPVFLDVDLDGYDDLLITAGHIRDIQDLDATEKLKTLQDAWRRNASGTNLQQAFVAAKREHTKLYPFLHMPVVAFRNLGNLRFEEVTTGWGLGELGVNHGIALADLDDDGDLDVVVNRLGAAAAIFRNESTAPRVAVRLRGQSPNTQGIGARVELLGGPVPHQKTEIVCGGSYLSGHDTLRVFAPGTNTGALRLRVTWRNGALTEIADVKPNHLYEIDASRASNPSTLLDSTIQRFNDSTIQPWFHDVSAWLAHTHHEEPFNDFDRQPLLPRKLSQSGPGVAWADINSDGWDDLLIGCGRNGRLTVFTNRNGQAFGRIKHPQLDALVKRDLTSILAFRTSPTDTTILAGAASYEDGDTNAPCLLQFSVTSTLQPFNPSVLNDSTIQRFNGLTNQGYPASVGPMALTDLEGDGDLDLFVGGQVIPGHYPKAASSLLFRFHNGQWQLDATNSRTLVDVGLVNGAVWSDLNGDGFAELLLACEWGPLKIFRNHQGTLKPWDAPLTPAPDDTTERSNNLTIQRFNDSIQSNKNFGDLTGLWTGVTTGDFDGDGQMDILACNRGLNSAHQASPDRPLTLFYGDLAGVGRTDVLETEYDPSRQQYAPRLQRDALAAVLPFVRERFPTHAAYSKAVVSDVLRSTGRGAKQSSVVTLATMLFLNRNGRFEARPLPIEAQFAPAFSAQVADFDGDGHEDAILSQNFFAFANEEARLDAGRGLCLRGDGRGNLKPVLLSGIEAYGEQRGAAVADFDKDGRVDVVITQNGAATKLYRNTGARPGLRVRLEGAAGNPDGIGAIVRLRYGNEWGPSREIHAGSGYWSQNSATTILGSRQTPTAIWVRRLGGQTTETPIAPGANELVVRAPNR